MRDHVAFPNEMVDRITPATGARELAIVADEFGVRDAAPVFCEDFMQWVLEDRFPGGRPALEASGVTFVDDVAPYEHMKIRILNGGHAIIAYPSALLDIHFVHEAMANPLVGGVPGQGGARRDHPGGAAGPRHRPRPVFRGGEPALRQSAHRRHHPAASASTAPTGSRSSSCRRRRTGWRAGQRVDGLALTSALWARYCAGETDSGAHIAPNDPNWDRLQAAAQAARHDPRAFLAMRDIFGDLAAHDAYVAAFSNALGSLWTQGTRRTLETYLGA